MTSVRTPPPPPRHPRRRHTSLALVCLCALAVIQPSVSDADAAVKFPGYKTIAVPSGKGYVRMTSDPSAAAGGAGAAASAAPAAGAGGK